MCAALAYRCSGHSTFVAAGVGVGVAVVAIVIIVVTIIVGGRRAIGSHQLRAIRVRPTIPKLQRLVVRVLENASLRLLVFLLALLEALRFAIQYATIRARQQPLPAVLLEAVRIAFQDAFARRRLVAERIGQQCFEANLNGTEKWSRLKKR